MQQAFGTINHTGFTCLSGVACASQTNEMLTLGDASVAALFLG